MAKLNFEPPTTWEKRVKVITQKLPSAFDCQAAYFYIHPDSTWTLKLNDNPEKKHPKPNITLKMNPQTWECWSFEWIFQHFGCM